VSFLEVVCLIFRQSLLSRRSKKMGIKSKYHTIAGWPMPCHTHSVHYTPHLLARLTPWRPCCSWCDSAAHFVNGVCDKVF